METIEIQSVTYVVESVSAFTHLGEKREMLHLRRPGGKVKYVAYRYGNGGFSAVTKSPNQS